MSQPEDLLAFQLKAINVPFEREVAFAKPRRWRADFVVRPTGPCGFHWKATGGICKAPAAHAVHHGKWYGLKGQEEDHAYVPTVSMEAALLIEIDGGTWTGGHHVTGSGHASDAEKRNAAVLLGYRPLTFSPGDVEDGSALQTIEKALA